MKQELSQIYADLSSGKLSHTGALDKIKAVKLQEQGTGIGTLLITPVWRESSVKTPAEARRVEDAERHIILCGLSHVSARQLESLAAHSHCHTLYAGAENSVAQRYSEYALACFERIQTVLRGKPQGRVLVQIVVADDEEHALLAGLTGLLKTAALEQPQLTGQLM